MYMLPYDMHFLSPDDCLWLPPSERIDVLDAVCPPFPVEGGLTQLDGYRILASPLRGTGLPHIYAAFRRGGPRIVVCVELLLGGG